MDLGLCHLQLEETLLMYTVSQTSLTSCLHQISCVPALLRALRHSLQAPGLGKTEDSCAITSNFSIRMFKAEALVSHVSQTTSGEHRHIQFWKVLSEVITLTYVNSDHVVFIKLTCEFVQTEISSHRLDHRMSQFEQMKVENKINI